MSQPVKLQPRGFARLFFDCSDLGVCAAKLMVIIWVRNTPFRHAIGSSRYITRLFFFPQSKCLFGPV